MNKEDFVLGIIISKDDQELIKKSYQKVTIDNLVKMNKTSKTMERKTGIQDNTPTPVLDAFYISFSKG